MDNRDCSPDCGCLICWQGYKKNECPKTRLENEKLFLSSLLLTAIGILLWCNVG